MDLISLQRQQQRRTIVFLCFVMLFTLNSLELKAAPPVNSSQDTFTILRDTRDKLEILRHKVNNQETELSTFEEKVRNHDIIIEALRDQHQDTNQDIKALVKDNTTALELKILNMESTIKGLVGDLGKLKTHVNETAVVISQCKQKIGEMEKYMLLQNQNIDSLQSAMRSITEALQKEDVSSSSSAAASSSRTYRIKAGDNLDKIARQNKTTIKAIKAINNLPNDRIVVGQTILLP